MTRRLIALFVETKPTIRGVAYHYGKQLVPHGSRAALSAFRFQLDVLGRYWDGMTCAPVAIKYRRQVAGPDA
jgi:hypothetical protein